ncbi:MAG TPA: zinc-binding dehydrogenase [Polyangiaceae bacterium]
MRAVVLPRFGEPEVLEIRDVPRPQPGPGEVVVRVVASGTNPVEAKIRATGTWANLTLPAVIGYDAAGVVEELGAGVTELSVGDEVYYTPEVFGNPHGTHAEYNVVAASIVAKKPASLGFVEAAGVPLAGGTAYEAIVRRLGVRLGDTVLIHGGAGGVGSFAVQIAKAAGARVLATAGSTNQALLHELGAEVPIDYTKQDPAEVALAETGGRGVDAVFDAVGGGLVASSIRAVRPFGQLATILPPSGDLGALYLRNQTLHGVFLTRERARLESLTKLIEAGHVRPIIAQVEPLDGVFEAHRRLDAGHGRGKIILRVSDAD